MEENRIVCAGLTVVKGDLKNRPQCPHGPTLVMRREKTKTEFYCCSAWRQRKACSFYFPTEKLPQTDSPKWARWADRRLRYLQQPERSELMAKLEKVKQMDDDKMRRYCHDCNELIISNEFENHSTHDVTNSLQFSLLRRPSELYKPRCLNTKEAQYYFSESATKFIVETLHKLNLRRVICIGTPRIFESIQNNEGSNFKSILLDIDERYRHFYTESKFCWYNMFNQHFFEGEQSENVFREFLKKERNGHYVIIMDPPFGGQVDPLLDTINNINEQFQKLNNTTTHVKVIWIYPYWMEARIVNRASEIVMLDYKIEYDNHHQFNAESKNKKGSPVRIFTNINKSDFELPVSEGYKYCKQCARWVSKENEHCMKCEKCTSKDGSTYKHCDQCKRCVKPSWTHCTECNRCNLVDHHCFKIDTLAPCLICNEIGHKKHDCPKKSTMQVSKRKQKNYARRQKKRVKLAKVAE